MQKTIAIALQATLKNAFWSLITRRAEDCKLLNCIVADTPLSIVVCWAEALEADLRHGDAAAKDADVRPLDFSDR